MSLFNLCSFCCCFSLTIFGVVKLTMLTIAFFSSSEDSQVYIKQENTYSNGTSNITQPEAPVSEEWKQAETYWNQVIEPIGMTILVFLLHLVKFIVIFAVNVVLLSLMNQGMLKARLNQT